MSRYNRSVPPMVWFRIAVAISLLIGLYLAVGIRLVHAQTGNTLTIGGNSSLVTFDTDWDSPVILPIYWGVSYQPMQQDFITVVNRHAEVVPPANTVSIFYNQPCIVVSTTFKALTADGWYEVPQAARTIVVAGNTSKITFTADYTPITNLQVTWGVSSKPAVQQNLTFTDRVAIATPPAGTVSMLFAPPAVVVSTTFTNLGAGWYAVPAVVVPPPPRYFYYLPNIRR